MIIIIILIITIIMIIIAINNNNNDTLLICLGQLCKITTRSAKFLGKNSLILISKDDKIVYKYFSGN